MRFLRTLGFTMILLLAGAAAMQAAVYNVRGVVLELRPETRTAVVRHEAIPGLMPAMTMPFVAPPEDFEKLSVDDQVEFEFVMEAGSASQARNFKVLGKASESAAQNQETPQRRAPKLEEGSVVPEVKLVDQDEQIVGLRDEQGRHTLLTFIFTRCPVPDFCPLISGNFAQLHNRLNQADLHDSVRLLSITIDPEFDTPEVLHDYGASFKANFDQWVFATAEPETIDFVASAFRVFRERDGARLDHALCTALVAPDGTVVDIWRGNAWKVDTVFERIQNSVDASNR